MENLKLHAWLVLYLLVSAVLPIIPASPGTSQLPVRPAHGTMEVLLYLEMNLLLPSIPRTRSQPLSLEHWRAYRSGPTPGLTAFQTSEDRGL